MGRFITVEGGDGSGKATQTKLLAEHARSLGYDVLEISFPRYGEDSAYYVEQYLNGQYGQSTDVPAELGTLTYALDRFAAKNDIDTQLQKPNSLVIADRYTASNLAHQGAKISDTAARRLFYDRTLKTEYEILDIPRPDTNLVLLVPARISQQNIDKKPIRSYTDQQRDIHEADADHLEQAKRNYQELCRLYDDEFIAIDCMSSADKQHTVEQVQEIIRQQLGLASVADS